MIEITLKVDKEWFQILGTISRHQDGFIWIEVKENIND